VDPHDSERARWFAEEVQPHEPSLRAVLRRRLGSLTDVDDLVQDTFIRVLRAREKHPIRSSKSFLFAVARNAMHDMIRRRTVAAAVPITETAYLNVLDDKPGVVDLVIQRQEIDLLAEAVHALPERCRQVFLLRKIQGLPQREIASRLGITENTVETLVAKGVHRCANYLRSHGLGPESRHGA
jgi:RNA polymerase sigma-70 factor (ECF subfamily)